MSSRRYMLILLVMMGTPYSLRVAGSLSAFRSNKKLGNLNGATLKFAATHVS